MAQAEDFVRFRPPDADVMTHSQEKYNKEEKV